MSKLQSEKLFVDASGWLAYLDQTDPNHALATQEVREAEGNICTSEQELVRLRCICSPRIDKISLSNLIWKLWDGKFGYVMRVVDDYELEAWEIYYRQEEVSPAFSECVSFVLVTKNNIRKLLSFSKWLTQEIGLDIA